MARLGQDRGRTLRVRQTNVPNGEVFAVTELDFIEGAYDPEHYEILGLNDYREEPMMENGRAVADETGRPRLVRVYAEIDAADVKEIIRQAAAERRDAKAEAADLQRPSKNED